MKWKLTIFLIVLIAYNVANAADDPNQESSPSLRQYYGGKAGYYQPSDGLNNGLLLGIDGVTEFLHHDFFLSGAIDLYVKQTFGNFKDPKPDITQQAMVLLPLHVNFAYKIFDASSADTRGYIGLGGGYYFYFYNFEYSDNSGLFGSLSSHKESKNGGNVFGTVFARVLIGQIFLEPRYYLAARREETVNSYTYLVNPTGFSITLGFQYH